MMTMGRTLFSHKGGNLEIVEPVSKCPCPCIKPPCTYIGSSLLHIMPLRLTNQRQSLVFTHSAHAIPHMQALRRYISRRARDAAIIDIHLYMYSYTLCYLFIQVCSTSDTNSLHLFVGSPLLPYSQTHV